MVVSGIKWSNWTGVFIAGVEALGVYGSGVALGVYGSGVTLGVYGSGMAPGVYGSGVTLVVYGNGRLEAEITAGLVELPGVFIAGIEALGVYGSGVAWEFMAPE